MNNIAVILLGAGDSRRFGGRKQFTLIDGKPMYMYIVENISKIDVNCRILVTQFDEMIKEVSPYPISVILNESSHLGISHSIKLGILAALKQDKGNRIDAFLFAVCDQPYLSAKSIYNLINGYCASPKGIACLAFNEELGNPVIFHKKYIGELLNLSKDTGGKAVLRSNLDDLIKIQADSPMELHDMDTKEQLFDKKNK